MEKDAKDQAAIKEIKNKYDSIANKEAHQRIKQHLKSEEEKEKRQKKANHNKMADQITKAASRHV